MIYSSLGAGEASWHRLALRSGHRDNGQAAFIDWLFSVGWHTDHR